MKKSTTFGRLWLLGAILAVTSLFAAACGSSAEEPAAAPADEPAAEEPAEDPAAEEPAEEEPVEEPAEEEPVEEPAEAVQVAYLSASSANTWLQSSNDAMQAIAAENNIELVEFDAQFDPAQQTQQFQDVIASGQYSGVVFVALAGAATQPDIEDALAAGLKVVTLNQVIGEDLSTTDSPVDGVSALIFEPPLTRGERLGEVTLAACEGIDPCNVVYFYGIRGIPLDEAVRQGWDSVVAGSTVNVIAEAEGQYGGPDVGLAAMQDILVSQSDISVVVGADQSIQGVELALADTDLEGVRLIGFGGSSYAVDAITEGRWWGGLYGAPATEGELAMNAMVDALAGTDVGGIDPSDNVPNRGLMLPDNVADFEAQWAG